MNGDWTVEFANAEAEAEVRDLPDELRTRFFRMVDLIERHGLEHLRMPNARHVRGKLWELRMKGAGGIARSIYVVASGRRVFVLRTFVKKSRKMPPGELALAARRAEAIGVST